jgi:hypothetical protein
MELEDYQAGMKEMMNDSEFLYAYDARYLLPWEGTW